MGISLYILVFMILCMIAYAINFYINGYIYIKYVHNIEHYKVRCINDILDIYGDIQKGEGRQQFLAMVDFNYKVSNIILSEENMSEIIAVMYMSKRSINALDINWIKALNKLNKLNL